jgi:hypothetical protein
MGFIKKFKTNFTTISEATELLGGSNYCTFSIMNPILIGIKKQFAPNTINYGN